MYFRNLFRSILVLIKAILIGVDRIGNALCAGYYRFTVSGRIGYFVTNRSNTYWRFLQWVVDSTFYPIDGKNHCVNAYKWEMSFMKKNRMKRYRRGNDIALFALSIIVVAACFILAPIIWLLSLIK